MLTQLRRFLVAVVLLAGVAYFLWQRNTDRGDTLSLVGATEMVELAQAVQEGRAPPLGSEIEAALDVEAAARSAAPPPAPGQRILGRVLTVSGEPLAGIPVLQEHPYLSSGPVDSDSDGGFELQVEEARGALSISGASWLLIGGERLLFPGQDHGYFLVAAPPTHVGGRVLDSTGRPISDALVRFVLPSDLLVPFGTTSLPLESESYQAWTDDDGRFRIAPVPSVERAHVEASHHGYETESAPATKDSGEIEIVLPASPR